MAAAAPNCAIIPRPASNIPAESAASANAIVSAAFSKSARRDRAVLFARMLPVLRASRQSLSA